MCAMPRGGSLNQGSGEMDKAAGGLCSGPVVQCFSKAAEAEKEKRRVEYTPTRLIQKLWACMF